LKHSDARQLRLRLNRSGLTDAIIDAAWPSWWREDADVSSSARLELRFSLARKLGLDPSSLLDENDEPRFIWRDEARFKNLTTENDQERAVLASFGAALGQVLNAATHENRNITGVSASDLRSDLLRGRPFVALHDLLSLSWSVGVPVVHLQVFPLPRKGMAAMTVRTGQQSAILLGKDSNYPAPVAFHLAHELGHIALGHTETGRVLVDFERDGLHRPGDDEEELQSDAYALELLTGEPRPQVLPSQDSYSAKELARVALGSASTLQIEPGTLALCFGYSTDDWATANAALRQIYSEAKPVWLEINRVAEAQLDLGSLPDELADFILAVLRGRSE
jgi:hypothetical protein